MKLSITLFFYLSLFSITSNLFGQPTEPDDLFPIRQNGKWGYINRKGVIIIEPQFLGVASKDYLFNIGWSEGLAPVRFSNGFWGYIDKTGKTVIEPRFGLASRFSEGLARVMSNGRLVAYINKTGEIVIPPRYCYMGDSGDFTEGLAYVEFIPGCISFSHSHVDRRTEYGYIDKTGKMILPRLGGGAWFVEGLAPVGSTNSKFGYMDRQGKTIIEPQFANAMSFDKGLAYVVIDKKNVYIDKTGKTVIDPPKGYYISCCNYSEGMATVVTKDRKYGYIDTNGKIVIKPRFNGAEEFSESLAAVNVGADKTYSGGKWGYIDKTGKVIIDFNFVRAEPFHNGLALIGDIYTGKIAYIDKTGSYIWKEVK